ncbi:YeeE/YedE family protein [Mucilaginibacter sp. HC2]|uniref:YeeE/YedE family protein n=2 Tax=Sphingobacteriaceae TaxID=84566 RepID=A0A966DRZ5_9SPHI|nr:YeeE/YedE family protein [Mucilaginibacter agri]NHA05792.1 YeeE/YedE family protein [Mucilaginibacter inviolabilis]
MAIFSSNGLFYDRRICNDLVCFTLFITVMKNIKFLVVGMIFGIILVKSQVISWFRIQEMFRLQAFHMYGIIGSAIVVGIISIQLIKRFQLTTVHGEQIVIPDKTFHWGNVYGGLIFGLGWAITGACPGPLFAEIGSGFFVIIVTLLSAITGTWTYGLLREKLRH